MSVWVRGTIAALVVLALTGVARTEELNPAERERRAHAWFERGRASFRLGDFTSAIREFEEGYFLVPQPLFLYNIASSARRAGQIKKAVESYRTYLKVRPDAPERRECERWIAELQKQLPPEPLHVPPPVPSPEPVVVVAPSPAPVIAPPPVVAPPPQVVTPLPPVVAPPVAAPVSRTKTVAGAVVTALGVGALAGGLACSVVAGDAADAVLSAEKFDASVEARGMAADKAATAMYVIGAAAVVTGVVVLTLGLREAKKTLAQRPMGFTF